MIHDPYAAHIASSMRHGAVGQLDRVRQQ
jgi:hypothetical protein